jgi:hypothetical protein
MSAITEAWGTKNHIFTVESYRPHGDLDIATFENDDSDFSAGGYFTVVLRDCNQGVGIRESCLFIL